MIKIRRKTKKKPKHPGVKLLKPKGNRGWRARWIKPWSRKTGKPREIQRDLSAEKPPITLRAEAIQWAVEKSKLLLKVKGRTDEQLMLQKRYEDLVTARREASLKEFNARHEWLISCGWRCASDWKPINNKDTYIDPVDGIELLGYQAVGVQRGRCHRWE